MGSDGEVIKALWSDLEIVLLDMCDNFKLFQGILKIRVCFPIISIVSP